MSCERLWAVEAVRDQRLTGAEAAAALRHQKTCRDCADEAQRLSVLRDSLRALPVRPLDDLAVRRQKQRLLSAADRQALARPPGAAAGARWRRHAALAVAAVAVAAAVALMLPSPAPTSPVAVAAVGTARWAQKSDGHLSTITIDDGLLSLHVRKHGPDQHVLVVVPDGEIEDLGTTFSVEVQGGRTTHVAVTDGAVAFRRHDAPPVILTGGQSWRPTPADAAPPASALPSRPDLQPADPRPAATPSAPAAAAPAAVAPSAAETAPTAPAAPATTTAAVATAGPATAAARVPGSRRPAATAPGHVPAAPAPTAAALSSASTSPEFRDGFQALRDGQPQKAAEQLARVADPQAEDAAYLRIVALARAGSRDQARALAREYLQKFPRGFRRPEVEVLARLKH